MAGPRAMRIWLGRDPPPKKGLQHLSQDTGSRPPPAGVNCGHPVGAGHQNGHTVGSANPGRVPWADGRSRHLLRDGRNSLPRRENLKPSPGRRQLHPPTSSDSHAPGGPTQLVLGGVATGRPYRLVDRGKLDDSQKHGATPPAVDTAANAISLPLAKPSPRNRSSA
jgi:hypothetical protein